MIGASGRAIGSAACAILMIATGLDRKAQESFGAWRITLEPYLQAGTESALTSWHLAKYRSLLPGARAHGVSPGYRAAARERARTSTQADLRFRGWA
jgi:hypothetical protein